MQVFGLICEFNPLHNGHRYLLDEMKKADENAAIVCVMSGNFTQRGEMALWNKFFRAEMAIKNGADLVLELPVYYAVNGASYFALGGIKVLKGLGFVNRLFFGSETGDTQALIQKAKNFLEQREKIDESIKKHLSLGLSYPLSLEKAAFSCNLEMPQTPNDILGFEYIKNSLLENANWDFQSVLRKAVKHDDKAFFEDFASGSYIRQILLKEPENISLVEKWLPKESQTFQREKHLAKNSFDCYFQLLRYTILFDDNLEDILEMGEGLSNKFKKAILKANDLDSFLDAVKSKRYTKSRLSRICTQILLKLNKKDFAKIENKSYARVLAFNKKGSELLHLCKKNSDFPIISNINQPNNASPILLSADIKATDLYNILSNKNLYDNSDQVHIPHIM